MAAAGAHGVGEHMGGRVAQLQCLGHVIGIRRQKQLGPAGADSRRGRAPG
jgi:hypothetical protein